MKKVNVNDIPFAEAKSPTGKFHRLRREISVALGAKRGNLPALGGHPFEVELVKLPPGAINWPYHSHSIEHEFYLVVSGKGQVRTPSGLFEVGPGDAFLHPPGEPHQIINHTDADLLYYVIADNQISDSTFYPDSGKWANNDVDRCFRVTEVDYYDGEE
jgi:uncharacterized cupin superfamily protein